MNEVTLTRQELYNLVWSEPLLSLSKKYKVPYPEFRQICVKMNIPTPGSAHWIKLKFGKPITIEPLEEKYTGESTLIISIDKDVSTNNIIAQKPVKQLQRKIEHESKNRLKIPLKQSVPDKLIVSAREVLNRHIRDGYGKGILFTSRQDLSITVTSPLIDKALRFMDALIKILRERGHDIIIRNADTYFVVEGTEIRTGLRERTVRVPPQDGRYSSDYKPTGVLCLKMDNYIYHKEWDDKKQPLEEQLSNIIAKLETVGHEGRIRKEENERRWEQEREKKRIAEELEASREKEFEKFKALLNQAKRLHEAKFLRDYINEVEAYAISKNTVDDDLKVWIDWARGKADWYDPLIEKDDELLDNGYRDNLNFKKKSSYF